MAVVGRVASGVEPRPAFRFGGVRAGRFVDRRVGGGKPATGQPYSDRGRGPADRNGGRCRGARRRSGIRLAVSVSVRSAAPGGRLARPRRRQGGRAQRTIPAPPSRAFIGEAVYQQDRCTCGAASSGRPARSVSARRLVAGQRRRCGDHKLSQRPCHELRWLQ